MTGMNNRNNTVKDYVFSIVLYNIRSVPVSDVSITAMYALSVIPYNP